MKPQQPIIIITGRQRPHEVFLLGYSAVLGVVHLLVTPEPESAAARMDGVVHNVWAAAALLSGILGLMGCYWRGRPRTGLSLERSGLLFNAACILTFAAMVVAEFGLQPAFFTVGLCAAWTTANVVRSLQIGNDLRDLRGADSAVT